MNVQFTTDETKHIQSAARRIWEECAYDLIQGVAETEGIDENNVSIPRNEVLEIVLDAGRLDEQIKLLVKRKLVPADLPERWEKLSYEEHQRFLTPAFPHLSYGT